MSWLLNIVGSGSGSGSTAGSEAHVSEGEAEEGGVGHVEGDGSVLDPELSFGDAISTDIFLSLVGTEYDTFSARTS